MVVCVKIMFLKNTAEVFLFITPTKKSNFNSSESDLYFQPFAAPDS